jgi:GNAT superfamily N-acetyltransferase
VAASEIEITVLDFGRHADRRRFLDVAAPIYRRDPSYVEPLRIDRLKHLDPAHNPALRELEIRALVASMDGRDVGRVTAHLDRAYDRHHGTRAGWFGFFESIDDQAVADALLGAATAWLRERGAATAIGPMSFTTNQECGLLVENFGRPPVVGTTYNPPYYERLLTSFGLRPLKDLYGWWIDVGAADDDPKIARVAGLAARVMRREGIVIRPSVKRNYRAEWQLMFEIYRRTWCDNWGYSPITEAEFGQAAESLRPILREELVLIVERRGRPVGFSFTIPDVNEALPRNGRLLPFGWAKLLLGLRRIRHVRLMLLGILPEYRKRGLESLLFIETARRCRALGFTSGEISWTLDDNVLVNRAIASMSGRRDRTWRLYELPHGLPAATPIA